MSSTQTKIFSGVTQDTQEFTPEQEAYIENKYQEAMLEVFGEDGHGGFKEIDNEKLLEASRTFIAKYVQEGDEQYEVVLATSPLDARRKAKALAGGDSETWTTLSYPWFSDRRFVQLNSCLAEFDDLTQEQEDLLAELGDYKKILNSGIFDITVAHNEDPNRFTAFVSPIFSWIETDEDGRLHSLEHPAIAWKDGYKEFAILGLFFEESVWKKIVAKEFTQQEVMEWKNDDEKAAILSVYGTQWLIENLNAQVVDTFTFSKEKVKELEFYLPDDADTYTLYKVSGVFPQDEFFVGYVCPSTGRKYFENVPPEEGQKGALAAIAWKFQADPADFAGMQYHA